MFLALLIDADSSLYVRHDCQLQPCPHRHLSQAQDWVTLQGVPVTPGRLDLFAPPPEGLMLTSFASPGRVFSGRAGGLSVKWAARGRESYELDRSVREVRGDGCLLINEGREYTSVIEPGDPAETFCLSFGRGLVADVARTLKVPPGRLLDGPVGDAAGSVEVLETVFRGSADFLSPLDELRRTMDRLEGAGLQERALDLLSRLLLDQQTTIAQVEGLESLRRSERLEVYRRLLRARDYMESTLGEAGNLARWAALADMSRFHFARSFKAVFGTSPHRYRMARRLERARELLQSTARPATDIALDLGFDSASHFADAYRRRFGETPGATRRVASMA